MSAPPEVAVLQRLADGEAHAPAALAEAAGIGEAAVHSAIAALVSLGLPVERLAAGAYQLTAPVDWLEAGAIVAALAPPTAAIAALDLRFDAGSSNDILLAAPPPVGGTLPVCLVEFQHGGRGRRGRSWTAPPGGALCLSAGWHFGAPSPDLSALSLAIGVAAMRAVAAATGLAIRLKWPNDLVFDARKLGGILVEMRSDASGTHVVAGVGINVRMPAERLATICDWPLGAIDLARATGGRPPDRSRLAAALVNELHGAFVNFAERGFAPFADAWSRAHMLADAPAVLRADAGEEHGVVRGVDVDGALLFESDGRIRRVLAGDVSLRPPA